jgi:hypothetical protein
MKKIILIFFLMNGMTDIFPNDRLWVKNTSSISVKDDKDWYTLRPKADVITTAVGCDETYHGVWPACGTATLSYDDENWLHVNTLVPTVDFHVKDHIEGRIFDRDVKYRVDWKKHSKGNPWVIHHNDPKRHWGVYHIQNDSSNPIRVLLRKPGKCASLPTKFPQSTKYDGICDWIHHLDPGKGEWIVGQYDEKHIVNIWDKINGQWVERKQHTASKTDGALRITNNWPSPGDYHWFKLINNSQDEFLAFTHNTQFISSPAGLKYCSTIEQRALTQFVGSHPQICGNAAIIKAGKTGKVLVPHEIQKYIHLNLFIKKDGKWTKEFETPINSLPGWSWDIGGSLYPITLINCGSENLGNYTLTVRIKYDTDFYEKVWKDIKGVFGFMSDFNPQYRDGYFYASLSVPYGQTRTIQFEGISGGIAEGAKPEWQVTGPYDSDVLGEQQAATSPAQWHTYKGGEIIEVLAQSGVACECPTHWRPPCADVEGGERKICRNAHEANDPKYNCCCSETVYDLYEAQADLKKAKDEKIKKELSEKIDSLKKKAQEEHIDVSSLPTCLCKCLKSITDKSGNIVCSDWNEADWCCEPAIKDENCANDNAIPSSDYKIMIRKLASLSDANCKPGIN